MTLSATVLGCSGTYASAGGACSGYLVRSDTTAAWLDCGPGTLGNLQRHVDLGRLDALVVTHAHPDHWLELPVLRNALKYGSGRTGLPVYAPAEVRTVADGLVPDGLEPTFSWRTVADGDTAELGDLRLKFSRTDHPVETLAVRVDAPHGEGGARSLAYSSDTAAGWSLGALGGPVDLALCEATMPPGTEGSSPHLTGRQAGALAADAGARRLLLTHLWPTAEPEAHRRDAEATFGAPVELALPHERYDA